MGHALFVHFGGWAFGKLHHQVGVFSVSLLATDGSLLLISSHFSHIWLVSILLSDSD